MLTWDVDDRRRHPWTVLYVQGMWLRRDKEAFEGAEHTRARSLQRQREGDAPPTWWTRRRVRVDRVDEGDMAVWRARPHHRTPVARVVHVHGGGYVHPLTADYWRLVRALTRVPAEVVVPAYPLAPGRTVEEVLPRLLDVVRRSGTPSLPTVLMGDSAGGALALVLARELVDAGGPRPVGVIALSPWLDAELAEDEVPDLEASDPMLAESGLRAAGRWWAGLRSPADPLVSPVGVDLDGLPPVDVFIGDCDILRPAVDRLADRARTAEVALHVHEVTSMFHVWMTRAIPEARRTLRQVVELVRRRAGANAPPSSPRGRRGP